MTGSTITSAELDPRRRRLLFRAWHRGIREMDLILGAFADTQLAAMAPAELDLYDALLSENDHDLYQWVSGQAETPPRYGALIARIAAHQAALPKG